MNPVEQLLNKNFKIKSFEKVLSIISSKEDVFFTDNLFIDKTTYIKNIQQLATDINQLSDAYKMAQEASKSGSIIQNFASTGLGSIQKEYIQKRKAMVHHMSLFVKKK